VAYCTKDDLLTGDIPLAGKYGDGTSFVEMAADEIDAQLGHMYTTPIEFDDSTPESEAINRPAKLLLKKVNRLLASGRIVLDMAAGGEDNNLHAYGASMWQEAVSLLDKIACRDIVLVGAPLIETAAADENTRVSITNEDPYSLVKGFYDRYAIELVFPTPGVLGPMRPYDTEEV
jgi:hypothetical protein